jgi:HlyD family secretion protein
MNFRPLPFALKYLLPLAAVLGMAYAIYRTHDGRPDDRLLAPLIAPVNTAASASANAGTTARVAGAGIIEPSSEVITVAPSVSGVVNRVFVAAGDHVKQGQPLFTLDTREANAQLGVRTAELTSLQRNVEVVRAELAERQALLALYEGINDQRAMVREELLKRRGAVELAQARVRASQAQVEAARAGVAQVRTQLELLTVRSPLDATVLHLRLRPGEFAAAATATSPATLSLGRTTPLHVRVDFDEADVSRLSLGRPIQVSARGASGAAGVAINAHFVRAEPVISPKRSLTNAADERVDTRVLQVIYALPVETIGFFVGQQVDAFLPALALR